MTIDRTIIVGTRGSPLALAQTHQFMASLKQVHSGLKVKVYPITTSGDRIQDRFLSEVGGKGLFVKEIEEALLEGKIDLAVHSLKDLPAELPRGLDIGCYPVREDPWDVLVTRDGLDWSGLKAGATLGTSSLRRRSQILRLRADFRFEMLRGNVGTRLKKMEEGVFDGVVLAKAGMKRLGLPVKGVTPLPIVPAPGQGTLAVEHRNGDRGLSKILQPLHHLATQIEAEAERHVMAALGGDCNMPLGVLARIQGDTISLEAYLGLPDGSRYLHLQEKGEVKDHLEVARIMVEKIWAQGGAEMIEACQRP